MTHKKRLKNFHFLIIEEFDKRMKLKKLNKNKNLKSKLKIELLNKLDENWN